jgi:hypothetical protein
VLGLEPPGNALVPRPLHTLGHRTFVAMTFVPAARKIPFEYISRSTTIRAA